MFKPSSSLTETAMALAEPFSLGSSRAPSTAFCLLYKFFTMKLTVKQMTSLLMPNKSPYIRAIGFLYLRYTHPPKKLWDWFEPYVDDPQEVKPSGPTGPTM